MATISENLQSLKTVKQDIRAELEKKGVDMMFVPFGSYASKISEISVGTNDKPTEGKSAIIVYAKNNLGEVIRNVTVTITGGGNTYTATSDKNGRVFQEVDAGTYTVSVGYKEMHVAPESQSVVAEVNETKYVYMTYTATTLTVIVKKDDGTPVVGAFVVAEIKESTSSIRHASGNTKDNGEVVFVLNPGTGTVRVTTTIDEYHTPEEQPVTVVRGQNTTVMMTYNRIKTALVIYAMDNGGGAIVGAEVTVTGDGNYSGVTDDTGLFYQEVPAGNYTISVNDQSGYTTPTSQSVSVAYGQELEVDMVYVATQYWDTTFANNDWDTIAQVSTEISSQNMTADQVATEFGWKLGDVKSETLSTGEVIELQIIGFNHDDKSDGSGKAGLTLQMKNCLATLYGMNDTQTNAGGWEVSKMRIETLPTIKASLPQGLQNVIKIVNKNAADGGSTNYHGVRTLSDDLFLLSEIELYGTTTRAQNGEKEGMVYEYWNGKANSARIKYVKTNQSSWWLRSSFYAYTSDFCQIFKSSGACSYNSATGKIGVSFALCI